MSTRDQLLQHQTRENLRTITIPKNTTRSQKKLFVQFIKKNFQQIQNIQDIVNPQFERSTRGQPQEQPYVQKIKKIKSRYIPFLITNFKAYLTQFDQQQGKEIRNLIHQVKDQKMSKQKRIEQQDFIRIFNNPVFTQILKEFLDSSFLNNKLERLRQQQVRTKIKQENIQFYETITNYLQNILNEEEKISQQTFKQLLSQIQSFQETVGQSSQGLMSNTEPSDSFEEISQTFTPDIEYSQQFFWMYH